MPQQVIEGFRLSPQQRQLWQDRRAAGAQVVQCAVTLEGADPDRWERALRAVVRRHEALRTRFACLPGMDVPIQVVDDEADLPVRRVSAVPSRGTAVEETAHRLLEEERAPFDPGAAPPVRCALAAAGDGRVLLIVTAHALCADHRSLENLLRDLVHACAAPDGGAAFDGGALGYVQFSEWQNELLEDPEEEGDEAAAFWARQVQDGGASAALPVERPAHRRTEAEKAAAPAVRRCLEAAPLERLAEPCGTAWTTPVLACWGLLLARCADAAEVPVRFYAPGRKFPELREAVGAFGRYLPLPLRGPSGRPLRAEVERLAERLREMERREDLYAGPAEEGDGPAAFGFDAGEPPEPFGEAGLRCAIVAAEWAIQPFRLRLSVHRRGGALELSLRFDPACFDREAVERLADGLESLLRHAGRAPETATADLDVLGAAERRQMEAWNATAVALEGEAVLGRRFAAGAALRPDEVAVVAPDGQLTFRALGERVDRLAGRLRSLGVGPEVRVALCLDRSLDLVTAILGVLAAGGAYVPFDPWQPAERLAELLEDAAAPVILCQRCTRSRVPRGAWTVVCLGADDALPAARKAAGPEAGPESLAYAIYTSGSTGRPKAALIENRSVANLLLALERAVYSRLGDGGRPLRVTLNAPVSFDASVKQWIQLLEGRTLLVVPEEVRADGEALLAWLNQNHVDVLDCTPSQLRLLLAAGLGSEPGRFAIFPRAVLVGGEAIDPGLWAQLARDAGRLYVNVYGPTECTVDATSCRVEPGEAPAIGGPLANVRTHVVDAGWHRTPVGVPGELCIAGAGLARGYAGRPGLTAEKFVPDPFAAEPGARLYRTGDRARFRGDGRLEYLGRVDHQVKIRGYRVELGEIEGVLARHPGVEQAVAALREDQPGRPRLVAYAVPRRRSAAEEEITAEGLREHARRWLPEFMVPSDLVLLDDLPVTPNGKVDRRALPAPEEVEAAGERPVRAPRTPIEEVLVGLFAAVLGLDRVGVDESFFDLGGHSLLATQLMARVRETYRVEMPLRLLFERPAPERLAESVAVALRAGVDVLEAIRPVPRDGHLPLSFAQQRLWFIQQLDPEATMYNSIKALRARGELDVAALEATFSELVRRQEVLRTTFPAVAGEPVQRIHPAAALGLPVIDLAGLPEPARLEEARRRCKAETRTPFDLAQEVVRFRLLRLAATDHVMLLGFHHVIGDAWSLNVIEREVHALYEGFLLGRPAVLPKLPVQYADFASWQRQWLHGDILEAHLAWWKKQLAGVPMVLDPAAHEPRPRGVARRQAESPMALGPEITAKVKALGLRQGTTLYMTLLSAFSVLMARFAQQDDLVLGTSFAGRERVETEGLVGCFVNVLPMRANLTDRPTFLELLGRMREVTLGAYAHQNLPFERLVEELMEERRLGRNPLVQVFFGIQNALDVELALPGLELEEFESGYDAVRVDLSVWMWESGEGLAGVWSYDASLFLPQTIERMQGCFERLLASIVDDPEARVHDLEMRTEAEKEELHQQAKALKQSNLERFRKARPRQAAV